MINPFFGSFQVLGLSSVLIQSQWKSSPSSQGRKVLLLVECACYIKGTENVFWKSVLNCQEGQMNDRQVSLTENLCALLNHTGTFPVMG